MFLDVKTEIPKKKYLFIIPVSLVLVGAIGAVIYFGATKQTDKSKIPLQNKNVSNPLPSPSSSTLLHSPTTFPSSAIPINQPKPEKENIPLLAFDDETETNPDNRPKSEQENSFPENPSNQPNTDIKEEQEDPYPPNLNNKPNTEENTPSITSDDEIEQKPPFPINQAETNPNDQPKLEEGNYFPGNPSLEMSNSETEKEDISPINSDNQTETNPNNQPKQNKKRLLQPILMKLTN